MLNPKIIKESPDRIPPTRSSALRKAPQLDRNSAAAQEGAKAKAAAILRAAQVEAAKLWVMRHHGAMAAVARGVRTTDGKGICAQFVAMVLYGERRSATGEIEDILRGMGAPLVPCRRKSR